jgi:hypothetical protein
MSQEKGSDLKLNSPSLTGILWGQFCKVLILLYLKLLIQTY